MKNQKQHNAGVRYADIQWAEKPNRDHIAISRIKALIARYEEKERALRDGSDRQRALAAVFARIVKELNGCFETEADPRQLSLGGAEQ